MKRIFTLLALAALTLSIWAQSPDLMTYQAVLRNAENHLLTNQAIAIQISILQGTPNSAPVYTEFHLVNTNDNGLVSLEIGDGVSGDDFSLIEWSSGPYFIKTETDPDGGTNYTITSLSQLLSVPFAKYADQAGNTFSGSYADLAGAPVNVSAFTNDEGYLTAITGNESVFDGWDKDDTESWSRNGNDLYYLGGGIGIGTASPYYSLAINSGASHAYSTFQNSNSGSSYTDGLVFGMSTNLSTYLFNRELGDIIFGTDNVTRMVIDEDGDVGIGITTPTASLQVQGDTKFGSMGMPFNELREIYGTTHASTYYIDVNLPDGYNEDNTRVLSLEINYGGEMWFGLGFDQDDAPFPGYSISYVLNGTTIRIYYPNIDLFYSRGIRALIMQIAM